jgi:hypothetical protein
MVKCVTEDEVYASIPENYLVDSQKVVIDGVERIVPIKNRYGRIQPVGAWGALFVDEVDTQKVARVLSDGSVDFLENSGRCVMQETLTGRYFVDLEALERELCAYSNVTSAKAYVCYGEGNKLVLSADVTAGKIDICHFKEYAFEKFKVSSQPCALFVNGEKII